jgi:hypothetical protein
MRRILIEHARRKQAAKHGGGHDRVPLVEDELPLIAAQPKLPTCWRSTRR